MGGHRTGRQAGARRVDAGLGEVEDVEFFGPGGRLFGCRHTPANRHPGRLGVVICSPILTDFGANYRREVVLARTLAAAGVSVQRFHPAGAGHSRGERLDLSLTTMVDDALTAAGHLADRTGVESVAFLGTRFGALAAARAARRLGEGPLALWEPVLRPRRYFREGVRAHNVHQLKLGRPGIDDADAELEAQGYIDLLGILVGPDLFHTDTDVDLITMLGDRPRPTLIVQFEPREGLRPELDEAAATLRTAGFDVTTAQAPTHENWWFVPDRSAPVDTVADVTTSWLLDRIDAAPKTPTADHGPTPTAPVPSEYPVFVDAPTGRLLAVVTEPAAGSTPNGLAAVMLRGAGWRPSSGPRRTQTTTTRALAGYGFHGIRFSYHGIAESGGEEEDLVRLDRPYVPDLRAVADWVAEQDLRAVVIGNCFGARTALAHAATDDRVAGLALLVPPVHDFEVARRLDRRPLGHFARRLSPGHIVAVLGDRTRRQALGRTGRALLDVAGRRVRRVSANGRHGPEWASHRLLEQLHVVLDRGLPVLFVYGEDDPYRADFDKARHGALGRLIDGASDQVRIEIVPGKVHGLTSHATQEAVLGVIEDWSATLPPAPAAGR